MIADCEDCAARSVVDGLEVGCPSCVTGALVEAPDDDVCDAPFPDAADTRCLARPHAEGEHDPQHRGGKPGERGNRRVEIIGVRTVNDGSPHYVTSIYLPGRVQVPVVMTDDDGLPLSLRGGSDRGPRDPDLLTTCTRPISHRRRDWDAVGVQRIVDGRLPLLEGVPCDRVEAVARLRRSQPDWNDEDLARHLSVHVDTLRVHIPGHARFRYGYLFRKGARDDDAVVDETEQAS